MMDWASSSSTEPRVTVNTPSKEALLSEIERRVQAGDGFTVATLNLDHAVKLRRDPKFRHAYGRHSFVVADGNPVVWLERLAGREASLVPGSELVEPVAGLAARHGVSVALIGSTDQSLEKAGEALRGKFPDLEIACRIAPAMGFDPDGSVAEDIVGRISRSGAGVVFLALGAPRQEVFAVRAHDKTPGIGYLSIGAGLDFLAGSQVRAPAWVRSVAGEWAWRLSSNPRRLAARYGACLAILPSLTAAALRSRRKGGADA